MKVLVTTDGSKDAATAMITAARILKREDLIVDVLCVAPELLVNASEPLAESETRRKTYDEYIHRITHQAKGILHHAQQVLVREGVKAHARMVVGSPADTIIDEASEYDLVVIGAHGRYERTQPGMGPIATRVVEYARTSVLIGRELVGDRNFRALVAVDGSEASDQAIDALLSCIDPDVFEVTLMHVVETPWAKLELPETWPDEFEESAAYQRQLDGELRQDAFATLERARLRFERAGAAANVITGEGDPALELISHVEGADYDLVVVGATGQSDIRHALLGSVSVKLAWSVPGSVLVVRE